MCVCVCGTSTVEGKFDERCNVPVFCTERPRTLFQVDAKVHKIGKDGGGRLSPGTLPCWQNRGDCYGPVQRPRAPRQVARRKPALGAFAIPQLLSQSCRLPWRVPVGGAARRTPAGQAAHCAVSQPRQHRGAERQEQQRQRGEENKSAYSLLLLLCRDSFLCSWGIFAGTTPCSPSPQQPAHQPTPSWPFCPWESHFHFHGP